ncbi:MAG: NUDIX domain-containing protein [Candidatus Competibacterales bacterium]
MPQPLPRRRRAPLLDAASLVMLRCRSPGTAEVLMGRRPATARFMPGCYVFPGGKVEGEDRRITPLTPLARHWIAPLAVAADPHRARALAVAALREAFEETGLALPPPAECGGLGPTQGVGRESSPFGGPVLDLAALAYVARAVTPAHLALRFHARFFAAPWDGWPEALPGDGELEVLRWVPLAEAHTLPTAAVTRFVIDEVRRLWPLGFDPSLPRGMYTQRLGQPVVRHPSL